MSLPPVPREGATRMIASAPPSMRGTKKGEKVDYVVDDAPAVLIEVEGPTALGRDR